MEALLLSLAMLLNAQVQTEPTKEQPSPLALVREQIFLQTGVIIELSTDRVVIGVLPHGVIRAGPLQASEHETIKFLTIVGRELNLYPKGLLKRARVSSVVLCERLEFAGQSRSAIPDFSGKALLLDARRQGDSDACVARDLHHELYHFVDYAEDKTLDRDVEWLDANLEGWKYGSGGASVQWDRSSRLLRDDLGGFVSTYAMSAIAEDKAEVFSAMMTYGKWLDLRAQRNHVLDGKVKLLKSRLRGHVGVDADAFFVRVLQREPYAGASEFAGSPEASR